MVKWVCHFVRSSGLSCVSEELTGTCFKIVHLGENFHLIFLQVPLPLLLRR